MFLKREKHSFRFASNKLCCRFRRANVSLLSMEKVERILLTRWDGFKFGFQFSFFVFPSEACFLLASPRLSVPASTRVYINNSSGINPICTLLFGSKVFWDAQQILTLSNWKACSILQGSFVLPSRSWFRLMASSSYESQEMKTTFGVFMEAYRVSFRCG